jgi:hypothetical protein
MAISIARIPTPQVQLVDPKTGIVDKYWYIFFSGLGGGTPLLNFIDDAHAAAGGVPINGFYRNGSAVMIRVT